MSIPIKERAKRLPAISKCCGRCGISYRCKASHADKSHFCSLTCYNESMRIHPKNDPRACSVCGKSFKPSRHHGDARFCSKACIWVATKGPEFNAKIARESAGKRGDALRHTGKLAHTYVKRGGRHEHRVVAERTLGRSLTRREVVHHIDENPKNNDPSNLMIITQGQHMQEHGLGLPGVTPKHRPWEKRRKGENDPSSKVCNADVLRIREMVLYGANQHDVGAVFDLSQTHVSAIARRVRWSHV